MNNLSEQNGDIEVFSKNIVAQEVENIMKDAYLEYAISVVVDRALPDARDGQKPVHRRILHAMNEMQVFYNKSYKKSARIVGDVIGKYHPHGDSSVYNAMVRMAQPFSMRLLLVDGQGNFGSVDGDSAAAMRYTEARMDKFSTKYMFKDIKKETVPFIPNYDGEELEPSVLPVQMPFLLINGVGGIAVGMAANIPPHNPIEALDCVTYKVMNRINNIEDSIDDLIDIMPSPDFPTGGHVHNLVNYKEAWEHGVAKFNIRAKWEEEEKAGRTTVIITEIPYQINKAVLVDKLEELTKQKADTKLSIIDGVQEVLDCSDKDGTRIEIKIKKDFDAEVVMNQLMASSKLQTSNHYNCTVLVEKNGTLIPKLCGLNELFDIFIDHRIDIITKRSIYDKKKANEKAHILEALIKAINPEMIDTVISTIKANKNQQDAKLALIDLLSVDDLQASAILEIRLSRLTGLETDRLINDMKELQLELKYNDSILSDRNFLLNIIIKESDDIKTELINAKVATDMAYNGVKYPYRERLSTFQVEKISNDLSSFIKEENCNIILSSKGFVRRVPTSELSTMNRGSRGKKQIELGKDDFIQLSINSHSHSELLFITDKGQCYLVPAYMITDNKKGRHVNYIFDLGDKSNEKVINILPVNFNNKNNLIAMFTKAGLVKLSKLEIYEGAKRKGGIKAITLRENDSILSAAICKKEDEIFIVNSKNKIIRFSVDSVNVVGRTATGVKGMTIDKTAKVVGAGCVTNENGYIVCVSKNGLLKITQANQYRNQSRGGKGLAVMKTNDRSGDLFTSFYVENLDDDIVTISKQGYSNTRPLKEFNITNRTTVGVKLLTLSDNDILVDAFNSPHTDENELEQSKLEQDELEQDELEQDELEQDELEQDELEQDEI